MKLLASLLSSVVFISLSRSQSVLFPLYVYPSQGAWDPIISALAEHPSLEFNIVVNPDNGPTPSPDANYIREIQNLRQYPNAHILGYVQTLFGRLPASTIEADIDEWNSWPETVRPTGIFFDEAERGEVAGSWAILEEVANYARDNNIAQLLVNNMGSRPVNASGYDLPVDQTVIFENAQSQYAGSAAEIDAITAPPEQLSIIIYSLPQSELAGQVDRFTSRGYGSVYFTDGPGYTEIYPTWQEFVDLLDANN